MVGEGAATGGVNRPPGGETVEVKGGVEIMGAVGRHGMGEAPGGARNGLEAAGQLLAQHLAEVVDPDVQALTGDVLGEVSLLTGEPHSLSATATEPTTLAVLDAGDIDQLTRLRPDIALVLYRNLARGIGAKLRHLDAVYAGHAEG